MKRNLQKLLGLFCGLFFSFSLFAQQYGQALKEDFENGIPKDWTQEIVSDKLMWTIESGDLMFPNGAFSGEKRVAFRNESGVTKNASTRLVSPIMDLSTLYRPLLIFAHAQDQWTKDVDVLRVLYRLSPESDWVELKVYDECITFWQIDTIKLVGSSKTYQIAFEAKDNLGRGIVIDDVEVRSTPKCDTPYALMVSELTSRSAVLNWLGAFDAKGFELKVSTERILPEQLNNDLYVANVKDTLLGNEWNYKLTGLLSGTKYYYYLRSICKNENSDWAVDSFVVANMITVPYTNDFNVKKTSGGVVSAPEKWKVAASNAAVAPFVNTCLTINKWYSSPDSTFALCFYGSEDVETIVPVRGGAYSYACLPEVEIEDVSKLSVSFTTINFNPHLSDRFSIIVGVMTDPNDKTTFTAVDTVNVESMRTYEECVVSLKNYKGKGKFITFMSDFIESNIFCMDNLKVDYTPEVMKVNDFKVNIITSTSVKIDFELEYPKYEVVFAKEKLLSNDIDIVTDVVRAEISNHGIVGGLENNTNYYIYARAIEGAVKGERSCHRIIRTPGRIETLPYTESFTINTADKDSYYYINYGEFLSSPKKMLATGLIALSNGAYSMFCDDKTCSEEKSSGTINLGSSHDVVNDPEKHLHANLGLADYDLWAVTVFPELPIDIKSVAVSFLAKRPYKEHSGYLEVGVMSVANDVSTFQAIDTIKLGTKERKYIYNLDEYDVKGQFWAFRVDSKIVTSEKNVACIDDVRFYKVPSCKSPSNIELVSIPGDPTKMTLTWDANGAKSWAVRLSREEYPIDSMFSNTQNYEYVYDNTVNTNSITFTDLRPSGFKYYYTICPICGEEKGNWTLWDSLTTNCYDVEAIPYVENFDNEDYLVGEVEGFAVPCMISKQLIYKSSILNTSPCLSNKKSASGANSVVLTKGKRLEENQNPYFALPKMAKPINELQLSFKTFGIEVQPQIWVGVMTDPLDTATFEVVDIITPIVLEKESEDAPDEFLEYIVSFAGYKGKGEHIALMLKDEFEYFAVSAYIDDIVVDNIIPCARPEKIKLVDFSSDAVRLSWSSAREIDRWRVVFALDKLTQQDLSNPQMSSRIVRIDTVTSSYTWFRGLQASTRYYVYIQSMCSDIETSKWSNYFTFTSLCVPIDIENVGVESFENYATGVGTYPDCYFVGSNSKDKEYVPYCDTKYKHTGQASMFFRSDEENNGAYMITNSLAVDDIADVKLNFWGYTEYPSDHYAHSIVVGVLTSPSDLATFVPVDTVVLSSEERPYEIHFHNYKYDYKGDRGKFIMFRSEFDRENRVYIDDISFGPASACPTSFYFDDITATSFKLRFRSNNAPYEIKYSTSMCDEELLNSNKLTSIIVTEDSLLIEGLTPYTTYYFYGRSTCGGKYGEWSNVNIVRTNCFETLPLPYFENFDNQVAIGQAPDCWDSYYQDMNIAYPALDNMKSALTPGFYPYSGSRAIYLRTDAGTPSYLVSHEIEVDDLSKCQVTFFAWPRYENKNNSVVVGVVTNVDSIAASFVPVDTILINQEMRSWEECVVSFENYKGSAKRIGFVSYQSLNETAATSGVYIDDILIELIPTCKKPKQFKFMGHTENSLTISFVGSGVDKYEATYGQSGFNVNEAKDIVEFTGTEFTLSGLEPAKYYDVYVRSVCSATNKSPWTYAGKYFTSNVLIRDYPYVIDFENRAEDAQWTFKQGNQVNKWYIGADTAHIVTDNVAEGNALYISNDGGKSAHYDNTSASNSWCYRGLNLEPGTYTISFDWTCVGEKKSSVTGMDYYDYFRVVLLPTTSVFDAGSNSITNISGNVTIFNTAKSAVLPDGCINLTAEAEKGVYVFNSVNKSKPLSEQWKSHDITFVVDEEIAGAYNIVFYWCNNSSGGDYANVRSAVVDNINIVKESCDMAYNLQATEIGENYANLAWDVVADKVKGFNVEVESTVVNIKNPTENRIVFSEFVENNSVKITGLKDNTQYRAYIQTVCDSSNVGKKSEPLLFTTACASVAVDSVLDFDDDDTHIYLPYTNSSVTNKSYPTPKCFVVGHDKMDYTSSVVKYFPNLISNTAIKQYSRSGDYALIFERTSTIAMGKDGSKLSSTEGGYIVLPEFEGEREDLQLSFWMRCLYNNPSSGEVGALGAKDMASRFSKKLSVGTMSDPADPTTFELITIFEYPYTDVEITSKTNVLDDPTGNEYWVECKLPLVGTEGKYIVLKNDILGDSLKYNTVYVDDIKLTSVACLKPEFIKFDLITTESVLVDCAHSNVDKHVIRLATDEKFSDNLRIDTVSSFPVKLENLQPSTVYYMQIQTLCSDEKSSEWSDVVTFTTLKTIAYTEDFNVDLTCPVDWNRANKTSVTDLFKGSGLYIVPTNNQEGWSVNGALFRNGLFSTSHMSVNVSCMGGVAINASKHWLLSPNVILPNKEKLHLVFDLALTDMNTADPIGADDINAPTSRFMVIISDDKGKTWKRENAVVWGNQKDDYVYFDIPHTGKKYSIDLDRFAGKTIQVAFYVESAVDLNTTTEIHIDNVHVNSYKENVAKVDLCEMEDYLNGEFYVHYSDLVLGDNYFDDWVLAKQKEEDDILNATTIRVSPIAENAISVSMCEGDVYSYNNFSELLLAGVYKQKLSSSNGCDSVVVLDLAVEPAIRVIVDDTICSGQKFVFNGKEYTSTGLYVDTLVSAVTGCDSIITLALKVNEAIYITKAMNICFGESYQFGSQTITSSGSYIEEFVSVDGCDSIVTLEATVLPDYRRTIRAAIKEGEKYNDNGFNGISRQGTYTLPLKSVDGCDSTITLNLLVLKSDTAYVKNEITTEDLPFEYESLYYDENTLPGTYVDTIVVKLDNMEYVVIHTLIVNLSDAIDNVMIKDLVMVPNPLRANQTLYILNDFTIEERIGLYVEVFDAKGQRVLIDEPRNYPITIDYLDQSGIYVVRIITGTGTVYTGKILFE
ncbi:MAG: T9SS type A sorting domain-containing protein [Paludibacteraceae bacterium]|nr:T9SS type A sorting domain-containing protein [Paludibacteraceae bacterium]